MTLKPSKVRPSVPPSCLPAPFTLFENIQAQTPAVIFSDFLTIYTLKQNLGKKKDFMQNRAKARENCEVDQAFLGCLLTLHFRISLPSRLPPPCPHVTKDDVLFFNSWRWPLGSVVWARPSWIVPGCLNGKDYLLCSKLQSNVIYCISFLSLRALVSSCFSDKNCNEINRYQ